MRFNLKYEVLRLILQGSLLAIAIFLTDPASTYAQDARGVARRVFPSVVLLVLYDSNQQPISLGSGFFLADDLIATNLHVLESASSGYVRAVATKSKGSILGVVAADSDNDLAVVRVSGVSAPSLSLGDDAHSEVGESVYAVGNPSGLEGTFSQGIISGIREFQQHKLLQITAPISPGSSGGPVVNAAGSVIGVAVATIRSGQNLNFAVPVSYLRALLQQQRPLLALSALPKSRRSTESPEIGEDISQAVRVVNIEWKIGGIGDTKFREGYSFVFRNKLIEPITDITFIVICYGSDGEPIHSELEKYRKPILGGLAKSLSTDRFSGDKAPFISLDVLEKTSRVEIRIIGFRVVHDQ
jgi:hypothetical protein